MKSTLFVLALGLASAALPNYEFGKAMSCTETDVNQYDCTSTGPFAVIFKSQNFDNICVTYGWSESSYDDIDITGPDVSSTGCDLELLTNQKEMVHVDPGYVILQYRGYNSVSDQSSIGEVYFKYDRKSFDDLSDYSAAIEEGYTSLIAAVTLNKILSTDADVITKQIGVALYNDVEAAFLSSINEGIKQCNPGEAQDTCENKFEELTAENVNFFGMEGPDDYGTYTLYVEVNVEEADAEKVQENILSPYFKYPLSYILGNKGVIRLDTLVFNRASINAELSTFLTYVKEDSVVVLGGLSTGAIIAMVLAGVFVVVGLIVVCVMFKKNKNMAEDNEERKQELEKQEAELKKREAELLKRQMELAQEKAHLEAKSNETKQQIQQIEAELAACGEGDEEKKAGLEAQLAALHKENEAHNEKLATVENEAELIREENKKMREDFAARAANEQFLQKEDMKKRLAARKMKRQQQKAAAHVHPEEGGPLKEVQVIPL